MQDQGRPSPTVANTMTLSPIERFNMHRSVNGFLNFAMANMIQKGEVQILCPCLTWENGILHNPFEGSLLAHLLRRGFVAGDTRWPKHGEEDVSDDGGNNDVENSGDEQAEPPEGGNNEHAHGEGNDEMPPEHEEDHETVTQDMSLATMLQDPHVKDLLRKKTTSERAAIKEAVKLAQLEIDTKTPLHEGCNPEKKRLHITLKLLDIKARFKSTDASLDATLKYLHKVLPKGNFLPRSVDEAKKILCPIDLPHVRYHADRKSVV